LIIAGSDSGGGAGIQADIKTVTMLGGFAMTAITAITAQNTVSVEAVMPVPTEMVLKQIDAVVADLGVDVVKIGMLGSAETAQAVADRLARLTDVPIVFDPVMVATSGNALADSATVAAFERLIALAAVVTPNVPELEALTESSIESERDLEEAARKLAGRTKGAVLAKGGHLPGKTVVDLLISQGMVQRWEDQRISTQGSHGTGCTLASAVATCLVQNREKGSQIAQELEAKAERTGNTQLHQREFERMALTFAVTKARRFVRAAMLESPGFGAGHGPLAHWAGLDSDQS
jgi:hydroxymethylpyrimidine/phosphomethylpyrimidine kinase